MSPKAKPIQRETAQEMSCGAIRTEAEGVKIFVAGGSDVDYIETVRVDVFSVATGEWAQGPRLPMPLRAAATVQFRDTLLLVGGRRWGGGLRTVMKLEPQTGQWTVLEQKLKYPRWGVFAMMVNSSMISAC